MAIDCYAVFKSTYNQAVADGLGTTVATAAAQSAMDACLASQNTQQPTAQSVLTVSAARILDSGPVRPKS